MDYEKAIKNLHSILLDEKRFSEILRLIFDMIDTDDSGTLDTDEIKDFVK